MKLINGKEVVDEYLCILHKNSSTASFFLQCEVTDEDFV